MTYRGGRPRPPVSALRKGESKMPDKKEQAVELLGRVRPRLIKGGYPQLGVKADEIVVSFLVCLEEFQKMQTEEK